MLYWALTDWSPPGEILAMPGEVIRGHKEWETACGKCHKRFDREAQSALCLACHDDIRADIRDRRFHGYIAQMPCNSCHSDHKGRDAQIVHLDEATFNHDQTRYKLREGHARVKRCLDCHVKKLKGITSFFARAPLDCTTCHKRDDVHKGEFSTDCDTCHNESDWKRATEFDHEKTEFPLRTGKHIDAKCKACHRVANLFKVARQLCIDCHKKDRELTPEHRKRYGDHCEDCHSDRSWQEIHFRHDLDTDYPLKAKHQKVKCDACHLLEGEIHSEGGWRASDCAVCEQSKGIAQQHIRGFAGKCWNCHQDMTCRAIRGRHSMTGRHLELGAGSPLQCKDCHLSDKRARYSAKKIKAMCVTCHEKEDMEKGHKGGLGENCEACHNEKGWNPWTN